MLTALITGVNGQDGSYLAEFLLAKGYRVLGTVPEQNTDWDRILHVRDSLEILETNLLDQVWLEDVLRQYRPNEIYNLAARASSSDLWTRPVLTGDLNALTVARFLEAILKVDREIRFFQASSSEVFGNATESPQTEQTPFRPRNPYGVAKAFGHWITVTFREHQGLFGCSGILYNHESPRRALEFVTRKISRTVAEISLGHAKELRLGRLDARRDWGFAGDYVQAMWRILQHSAPDDYILATGESHSVRDFCEAAFAHVGLNYRDFVVEDAANFRQDETSLLVGCAGKAERVLGWRPTVGFRDLVGMMVDADVIAARETHCP